MLQAQRAMNHVNKMERLEHGAETKEKYHLKIYEHSGPFGLISKEKRFSLSILFGFEWHRSRHGFNAPSHTHTHFVIVAGFYRVICSFISISGVDTV